jgi:hypothetical protein
MRHRVKNYPIQITGQIAFEIHDDGLYESIDGGEWHRIADKFKSLALVYLRGRLAVSLIDLPNRRPTYLERPNARNATRTVVDTVFEITPVADRRVIGAVGQLRDHLAEMTGIKDLIGRGVPLPGHDELRRADGFLVTVPGIGRLFAIKPEALRNWVTGSVPIGHVLAAAEQHGWLVRGADKKTTRQIKIPFLGRHRFYCFKLAAAIKPPEMETASEVPKADPVIAPYGLSSQGIPLTRPLPRTPTWD